MYIVIHDKAALLLLLLQCFQHSTLLSSSNVTSTLCAGENHNSTVNQIPAPPGTPLKVNLVSSKVHSQAFTNQTRV